MGIISSRLELEKDNRRLQKENERLKEKCTLYDCGNKERSIDYQKLQDEYTELLDKLDDVSYERTEYKQALQEIRDIANGIHDWWINKTKYTDVYELAEHLLTTEFNRIIDEIDEVIGD